MPHVKEIALKIRMEIGFGGANFPGAKELYVAADKIEKWDAKTAKSKYPPGA